MDRQTKLAELGARRLAALTARRRALLRGNTQALKRAVDELRRINREIFECGPKTEENADA